MSDRDEFGSFLVGFIVGGLAGAVTALLLAPQSGEETRTLIKEKSIELKDKAAETVEEASKRAEEAYIEARNKAEEWTKVAAQRFEEAQNKGAVVIEEQKAKFGEAVKSVTKKADAAKPAKAA
ncbi:MAG: YtxH domain-containing protein [Anaerolineaceae bacterium]|jgi:gas vesicle protein